MKKISSDWIFSQDSESNYLCEKLCLWFAALQSKVSEVFQQNEILSLL